MGFGAAFDLSLRPNEYGPQSFSRLKFFLDGNASSSWLMQAEQNSNPYLLRKEEGDSSLYSEVVLENSSHSFSLATLPSATPKEFYGVSLENNNPGVLYHMIGVNGARYDHFNAADLFWKQLPISQILNLQSVLAVSGIVSRVGKEIAIVTRHEYANTHELLPLG